MTSITIKLPEELKEKLEAQARVRGKSCSAVVRDSLEKDLAISKKPSLLDRLHDLAGKGDSGIADLATDPKYLKGFGQWRE
jgi:Arc/MetJ-type ribon-helix-helix transcriptional regulator